MISNFSEIVGSVESSLSQWHLLYARHLIFHVFYFYTIYLPHSQFSRQTWLRVRKGQSVERLADIQLCARSAKYIKPANKLDEVVKIISFSKRWKQRMLRLICQKFIVGELVSIRWLQLLWDFHLFDIWKDILDSSWLHQRGRQSKLVKLLIQFRGVRNSR